MSVASKTAEAVHRPSTVDAKRHAASRLRRADALQKKWTPNASAVLGRGRQTPPSGWDGAAHRHAGARCDVADDAVDAKRHGATGCDVVGVAVDAKRHAGARCDVVGVAVDAKRHAGARCDVADVAVDAKGTPRSGATWPIRVEAARRPSATPAASHGRCLLGRTPTGPSSEPMSLWAPTVRAWPMIPVTSSRERHARRRATWPTTLWTPETERDVADVAVDAKRHAGARCDVADVAVDAKRGNRCDVAESRQIPVRSPWPMTRDAGPPRSRPRRGEVPVDPQTPVGARCDVADVGGRQTPRRKRDGGRCRCGRQTSEGATWPMSPWTRPCDGREGGSTSARRGCRHLFERRPQPAQVRADGVLMIIHLVARSLPGIRNPDARAAWWLGTQRALPPPESVPRRAGGRSARLAVVDPPRPGGCRGRSLGDPSFTRERTRTTRARPVGVAAPLRVERPQRRDRWHRNSDPGVVRRAAEHDHRSNPGCRARRYAMVHAVGAS